MWRWAGLRTLPIVAIGLLALPLTGCGSSAGASPSSAASIVALGDSVPSGYACDCTPFPELSAAALSPTGGPKARIRNDAVGGYTTVDVLQQLGKTSVRDDLRHADLVELEVGANDVAHSDSCGDDEACYLPEVPQVEKNLADIVDRIHDLGPAHVVLLDYWSVWLGGQYARDQGEAYVDAADEVTEQVNGAIRAVAVKTRSTYVDLRSAFRGPDYSYDDTHYLAPDGDHPNAAGHRRIAAAVAAEVRRHTPVD